MTVPAEPPTAIVLLIDGSLSLATQWALIFSQYVAPLLRRLNECYPSQKVLLAFLCYGSAETRPTPIICRRFFHDLLPVTRVLKDEFVKMGIGSTATGNSGLATLEGLVAALEMFDTLLTSFPVLESGRKPTCHVFHITASLINDAIHPHWNENALFDDVTWETLSDEYKKRQINYSCMNIGVEQHLPQLAQFFATFDNPIKPWFNVAANHTVMLSGYPIPGKGTAKRPFDAAAAERSPELKRQRIAPPVEAPLHLTATTPAVAPTPSPAPTAASLPPPTIMSSPSMPSQPMHQSPPAAHLWTPSNSAPPPQVSPPPQTQVSPPAAANGLAAFATMRPMELVDRYRIMEHKMTQLGRVLTDCRAKGDAQGASRCQMEMEKIRPQLTKMTQLVKQLLTTPALAPLKNQIMARLQATQPNAQGQLPMGMMQASSTMPINTGAPSMSSGPQTMQSSLSLPEMNIGVPPFTPPQQMNQTRSASGDFGMNMGMQNGQSASPPNMNMMSQHMASNPSQMQMNQGIPNQPVNPPKPPGGHPIWHGPLCWSGVDGNNGKREMQAHVMAVSQNNGDFRVHTWPTSLMLTPTTTPAVSPQELQAWVKKTGPAMCMFVPQQQPPPTVDKTTNDGHFKSLISLLQSRKIYAVASWTLPNGSRNPGCLIFPVGIGLIGAFFPVEGIPEMPRSVGNVGMTLPPQVEAHLQKLAPEERNNFMSRYILRARAQAALINQNAQNAAAMQAAQGQGGGGGSGGMMPQYMGMGMGQPQMQQQAGQPMMNFGMPNTGQPQAGLPRPMQAAFTNEILQSFMQRNPGQDGHGQGQG